MAVRPAAIAVPAGARPRAGTWTILAHFARKKPLGAAGGALMLVMVLTAIFAELLQTHDPIATDAAYTLGAPNAEHWLAPTTPGRTTTRRSATAAAASWTVGSAPTRRASLTGGTIG